MAEPLLEIRDLKKHFPIRGGLLRRQVGAIRAVDGVSLKLQEGEALGLVGESGSGKTTLGKTILRLVEPTSGQIIFAGVDISTLPANELRQQRAHMQMIFQNPYSSLNPRMKVKDIVAEPLIIHNQLAGRALSKMPSGVYDRVRELIHLVGLSDDHLYRYAHEFSGGQRQRIGVARALALQPKMLVLDEPTSALDVSVQAQVLNLLLELQERLGLTYLFISHDLGVIRYTCDRVALMYLGCIIELAPVEEIFDRPLHPYTQALRSAMPEPDPDYQGEEIILEGEISILEETTQGCRFAPRCPAAKIPRCYEEEPELLDVGGEHFVACHLHH